MKKVPRLVLPVSGSWGHEAPNIFFGGNTAKKKPEKTTERDIYIYKCIHSNLGGITLPRGELPYLGGITRNNYK